MAVRTSFPETPSVSRLPINSSNSISGGAGGSVASAVNVSSSNHPGRIDLTCVLLAFEPFVEFQLGEEIWILLRTQQLQVAYASGQERSVRR